MVRTDPPQPPTPPFVAGQRVRCRADTLGRTLGVVNARTQLQGRAGTVEIVRWHAPLDRPGIWEVWVRYDHLSVGTWPTGAVLHLPDDLIPIGE